jgi:hypothetical protein
MVDSSIASLKIAVAPIEFIWNGWSHIRLIDRYVFD